MIVAAVALAAHIAFQPLVVRTYDTHGVPPADLAEAYATAGAILESAGIFVLWQPCEVPERAAIVRVHAGIPPSGACDHSLAPAELSVRIVSATSFSGRDSLGYSMVDVQRKVGWMATVFADRVADLSAGSFCSRGRLLGRAMAHEIGHLLLGSVDHAHRGLMRARWTTRELDLERLSDWLFSTAEGVMMRRALAVRSRQPIEPVAVVADLEMLVTGLFSARP
jgi:hypothetical protein